MQYIFDLIHHTRRIVRFFILPKILRNVYACIKSFTENRMVFFFVSKQYSMKAGHTCVKKERKRKKQTTNER